MPATEAKKIEICVPGCREKFVMWCKDRGGIKVWKNVNLSDPGAGDTYSPVRDFEGKDYPQPHWSVRFDRIITDVNAFRFVKELKEVKRFRVAIRQSGNGLMMKCTDASSARIRREMTKASEKYGEDCCREFDYETQECVILVPVWEN